MTFCIPGYTSQYQQVQYHMVKFHGNYLKLDDYVAPHALISSNPGRSYGLQCCHKGKTAAHLGEKTLQCQAILILVQGISGRLLLKVNCGICNIITIYFVYRHFDNRNCSVMLHQTTTLTNGNNTIRPIRCSLCINEANKFAPFDDLSVSMLRQDSLLNEN